MADRKSRQPANNYEDIELLSKILVQNVAALVDTFERMAGSRVAFLRYDPVATEVELQMGEDLPQDACDSRLPETSGGPS